MVFAKLYDVPRKEQKPRVEEALEFMGLSDAANRMVNQYSGGMIRKLEIGQTLIHRPRVLFLDEPTIGLDPVARRNVWKHLDDLRRAVRHDAFPDHALYGRSRGALHAHRYYESAARSPRSTRPKG